MRSIRYGCIWDLFCPCRFPAFTPKNSRIKQKAMDFTFPIWIYDLRVHRRGIIFKRIADRHPDCFLNAWRLWTKIEYLLINPARKTSFPFSRCAWLLVCFHNIRMCLGIAPGENFVLPLRSLRLPLPIFAIFVFGFMVIFLPGEVFSPWKPPFQGEQKIPWRQENSNRVVLWNW